MYNEVLCLIKRVPVFGDDGRPVLGADGRQKVDETTREVYCALKSIGSQEFYQSSATEYHPEAKFVLSDYLDYEGETLADYNGKPYRIIRTYRTGQRLELTVESAPAEEAHL